MKIGTKLLQKIKNTFTTNSNVKIMSQATSLESSVIKREILFKVDKLKIPHVKALTPILYSPNIFTFGLNEVKEKKIQEINVDCDETEAKIKGSYTINNKYISCNVYYSAALMNENVPYAMEDDIITIEPLLYCGSEYFPSPTKDDFHVNFEMLETQLEPVMETEDLYYYLLKLEISISLNKMTNRLPMLERTEIPENSGTYKFIQDISYLEYKYGKLPDITVPKGKVSDYTIIWDYELSGNDVSFEFYDSRKTLNTTFVYLKNYNYIIDEYGTITKYTPIDSTVTKVDIPRIINEIEVKSIGNYVFKQFTNIESINIPESVESIGLGAFYGCNSLKSINIPQNVESIGAGAFMYCTKLESINIPESVKSIAYSAFEGCTNLKSINIPQTIYLIEKSTFSDCTSIESIEIPYHLCQDKKSIFSNCSNVTSLSIIATSDEINPNQTKQQLLEIWKTCATNLSVSTTIAGKYIIIDGKEKDLS